MLIIVPLFLSCLLLLAPLAAFNLSLCVFCVCKAHRRETGSFFAASEVEHSQHNQDQFRFRRAAFYSLHNFVVGMGSMARHATVQQMQDQVLAWRAGGDQTHPPPTNVILDGAGVFTEVQVQVVHEPTLELLHMRQFYADFIAMGDHAGL